MKSIAAPAMAAIEAGEAIVTGAAQISPRDGSTPIRVWGGYGVIAIGGNDYQPLGDRALAQQTTGALGGIAQGMTLTLSGVEPAALALLDPAEVKGASVVVYRLIFASDGKTLLDAHVFDRGRGDAVDSAETIGGAGGDQIFGRKRCARPRPQRGADARRRRPAADQCRRRLFQEHRLCGAKDALLGRQEAVERRRGRGAVAAERKLRRVTQTETSQGHRRRSAERAGRLPRERAQRGSS
jgi:hypothetical protein